MSAGASARPRRCRRSPPSSARCRTAPASRSAPRCWASRSTARPTSPASRRAVAYDSMDLLQAAHTFSGIEMALWDLLGQGARRAGLEAARLPRSRTRRCPTPRCCSATRRRRRWSRRARRAREGFRAASSAGGRSAAAASQDDADQLAAAREGLGPDGILLVDAGQIWVEDVERAAARLPALEAVRRDLAGGAVPRQRLRGLCARWRRQARR